MGALKTKNHMTKKAKTGEMDKPNKSNIINEANKAARIYECIIKFSPFEDMDPLTSIISKSICKIKIKAKEENGLKNIYGSGFLLKCFIGLDQELFYCLMSNKHVISKDIINSNNNVFVCCGNETKIVEINLDEKERYIKNFEDIGLDITVVEILYKDNISGNWFLIPELETINNLINSQVYIPQYPKGEELKNSRGKLIEINQYELTHLASTDQGSSGSPIFLENSYKVIGIHKSCNKNKTENYGDFIYPAVNIIENDIRKKRENGNYINDQYIWGDGKYYKGQFKNNLPNGKGVKYYSNGDILYEGDFNNGKFEGNGKYNYKDGSYFIGIYKNGLRNGKGMKYYRNGNIMYEGEYIDGKLEGNVKYILM